MSIFLGIAIPIVLAVITVVIVWLVDVSKRGLF
jgi:hypothetical protein